MVQLIIDYATNKILGFNTIIPENTTDLVLIEDDELNKIHSIDVFNNLYYEDGQIVEKDEIDPLLQELKEIDTIETEINNLVENEQKVFIDNILAGKTTEEAASIAKNNREQLENIKNRRNNFNTKYLNKKNDNLISKFENEEEKISNKYFLSIITAVRDEEEYIEEWLNYHIEKIGVEHFYIYDNESSLPLRTYLENVEYKYLDKITIIDWNTSEHTQQDTCNDWLNNYKSETKWFICMDVDEFIQIKENQDKSLVEFLNENSKYSSVQCLWKHYTADGKVEKTNEPVVERFKTETDWSDWKHGGKYFAQSNRVSHFISYVPQVRLNTKTLNFENKEVSDFYQLNHYFTKSYEEWVEKINRGSVNPNYLRKYQEFFEINPDMEYLNTGENIIQSYGSVKRIETEVENE